MKILKTSFLALAFLLLLAAFPVEGTTGSLRSVPSMQGQLIFLLGWVQQYLLAAGEPLKLMILGAGFVLLAFRLRQRTADNSAAESQAD